MIYVIRHGETEWNSQDRVLGRTDIPLNEVGRSQAAAAAAKASELQIGRILTSPLSRAYETARIVSSAIGARLEICDALIEMDFGLHEGQPRKDPSYQKAKRDYFARYEGGESFFDVVARIYPLIAELEVSGENVLLSTHNGICRVICSYYEDMGNEAFVSFAQRNCEIRAYEPRNRRTKTVL